MNIYLDKAKALKQPLYHQHLEPIALVEPTRDDKVFQGWTMRPMAAQDWRGMPLYTGDTITLDFGRHMTGYLTFDLALAGNRQDAPAKLRFTFGEMPCEVAEPFSDYTGWISSAWLQEETVFFDRLPARTTLPRRYAFRYVKLEVLATSQRFGVKLESIACDAVTSADVNALLKYDLPPDWMRIYNISAATLRECMQYVFEDGPKRDRRLWMGDLRLEALANYYTFRNNDLVKRCLYLFAGTRDDEGHVMAALYDWDTPINDETCLIDYAMLFGSALYDYYSHTQDMQTAQELFPIALDQIRIVADAMDANGTVTYGEGFTCFIDWCLELDKHAAAQGVFLYAAKQVKKLALALGDYKSAAMLDALIEKAAASARNVYWDEDLRRFVSGESRQVSWASQVWMVLGGALPGAEARCLMLDVLKNPPPVPMVTPYMVHHMIEALFAVGEADIARAELFRYWNGMADRGADCFWEIYLPDMPEVSPYGHNMIHSYCHAWSCTPAYFIGRYMKNAERG